MLPWSTVNLQERLLPHVFQKHYEHVPEHCNVIQTTQNFKNVTAFFWMQMVDGFQRIKVNFITQRKHLLPKYKFGLASKCWLDQMMYCAAPKSDWDAESDKLDIGHKLLDSPSHKNTCLPIWLFSFYFSIYPCSALAAQALGCRTLVNREIEAWCRFSNWWKNNSCYQRFHLIHT